MEGMVLVILFFLAIIAFGIKKMMDNYEEKHPEPTHEDPPQEQEPASVDIELNKEEIASTKEFIDKISNAFADITEHGGRIPTSGPASWIDTENVPYDCVRRLRDDCKLITSELPKWTNYPFFEEVLLSEIEPNPIFKTNYEHPVIPLGLLHKIGSPVKNDLEDKISTLLKKVNTLDTALLLYGEYEYKTCRVAGTSFKNDDGSNRQEILKKIRYKGAPYRTDPDIRLEKVQYDGEDAVAVYANENQIGWIAKSDLSGVLPRFDRYNDVDQFSMHGGGSGGKNYGMDIRIRFYKKH